MQASLGENPGEVYLLQKMKMVARKRLGLFHHGCLSKELCSQADMVGHLRCVLTSLAVALLFPMRVLFSASACLVTK